MFGRDPCLRVISGECITLCGLRQPHQPNLNFLTVPEIPVLVFQQNQSSGCVLACGHPRCMQMHQSQQRERFRSIPYRMLRQDGSQPYGFVAKLSADGRLRV